MNANHPLRLNLQYLNLRENGHRRPRLERRTGRDGGMAGSSIEYFPVRPLDVPTWAGTPPARHDGTDGHDPAGHLATVDYHPHPQPAWLPAAPGQARRPPATTALTATTRRVTWPPSTTTRTPQPAWLPAAPGQARRPPATTALTATTRRVTWPPSTTTRTPQPAWLPAAPGQARRPPATTALTATTRRVTWPPSTTTRTPQPAWLPAAPGQARRPPAVTPSSATRMIASRWCGQIQA